MAGGSGEATPLAAPAALGDDAPAPAAGGRRELRESDPRRSPDTDWAPWTAVVALLGGLVLAAVGGLVVDIPAALLGVTISSSHTPAGLAIADTFVQDVAFVVAAAYCAQIGGRTLRAWQLGLRPPGAGWRSAARKIALLIVLFILLDIAWSEAFSPGKDKLLQQLGSNESALLLLLSAGLTCVVAPMAEEILFRGYMFTALRNWRGTGPAAVITGILFGAVHAGSAPVLDLIPLAVLGFGLCLLYRYTGSLYACMVAHCLNNCIAFAGLEGWWWQGFLLAAASLLAMAGIIRATQLAGLLPATATAPRRGGA
jgi:membrane protease YdiL (CAAX protease family)